MTVCIAARSGNVIFLVSDRMIASGDIQFEPPAAKIIPLTSAIAIAASGDSSFHNEVVKEVSREMKERIVAEPSNWWLVKDVVGLYIKYRIGAKIKRAEAAILVPLGLDRQSWLNQQKLMELSLVKDLAADLINFSIPNVSVIVAGIDNFVGSPTPHNCTIHNEYISCDDIISFSAIGSGARHAESQFMLAGHAWNSPLHPTAALVYRAKKDSEIAPGVGKYTDMYMTGPGIGQMVEVRSDIQEKIEQEYQKMKKEYAVIQSTLNKEGEYVDSLTPVDAATQTAKPEIVRSAEAQDRSTREPPKSE